MMRTRGIYHDRIIDDAAVHGDRHRRGSAETPWNELLRELRPLAPLNWSPMENLHITSKFIGEWPEQRLGELKQRSTEIAVLRPHSRSRLRVSDIFRIRTAPGCCSRGCRRVRSWPTWRGRSKSAGAARCGPGRSPLHAAYDAGAYRETSPFARCANISQT